MNKRSTHNKGIWIVAAAAVTAAVILICALFGGNSGPLSGVLGVITTPLRAGLSAVTDWVEERYNYAFRYDELMQENEALKQRVAELERAAREGEDALEENDRYRDLLGLTAKRTDLDLESAYITARGATNWASTMTLNKGTKHGIAVDNCVIDQYGNLVGVVKEVSYNWCSIITVVDAGLEMGGLIARTNSAAILEGNFSWMGQGKLTLTYLPENTQIISGDEVLTSGMGGVYPSGLKVGTIDEILTQESGMSRYAVISPSTKLDELRQVFIIKQFDIVE